MKKLTRDEFGYVNNRGRSQYWGVTVAPDERGRDTWVVSYKPADGTETHSLRPTNFALTERDAARIAAAVYETGQTRPTTVKLKVLSADKKWVYGVRGNELWREAFGSQSVYVPTPTLTLLDTAAAPNEVLVAKRGRGRPRKEVAVATDLLAKAATRKPRAGKSAKAADAYTAKLAAMILGGNLSSRSSKALIAVLESTMK